MNAKSFVRLNLLVVTVALACASAQACPVAASLNIPAAEYTLFTHHYECGGNTVSELFDVTTLPNGFIVYVLVPNSGFVTARVLRVGPLLRWSNPNLVIPPGTAVVVYSPSAVQLDIGGTPTLLDRNSSFSVAGVFLLGRTRNLPGGYDDIVGSPPTDCETALYRHHTADHPLLRLPNDPDFWFTRRSSIFDKYLFIAGAWRKYNLDNTFVLTAPMIDPHEVVLILSEATSPAAIVSQTSSLVVDECAEVILSVTTSGGPLLLYQWERDISSTWTPLLNKTESLLEFPLVSPLDAGTYRVIISNPCDGSSVMSDDIILTVTPNTGPPQIVSSALQCGATGNQILLEFDETLAPASVSTATYSLVEDATTTVMPIASATLVPPDQVILSIPSSLPAGTYTLAVSGVTDLCGNPMSDSVSLTHSPVPPQIVSSVSRCGLTADEIILEFDIALAPASVSSATYSLVEDATTTVVPIASATLVLANYVVLSIPSSLPAGTYTLAVSGVADLCGNPPMSDSLSLTLPPGPLVTLSIVALNFDCGTRTTIDVFFSEPLDPANAADVANYDVDGNPSLINSAFQSGGGNQITLSLNTALTPAAHTLTVSGVKGFCGNVIVSVPQSFGCAIISGKKFNDANNDNMDNDGLLGLDYVGGWLIGLSPSGTSTFTDANGNYTLIVAPGTYTVSESSKKNWTQTFPASLTYNSVTVNPGDVIAGNDFGNHLAPVPDLGVFMVLTPMLYPCCGQPTTYVISYFNQGGVSVPGVLVELAYDNALLTYQPAGTSPLPLSGTANPLQWNLGTLAPQSFGQIFVEFMVDPGCLGLLPVLLNATASITPLAGDVDPTDNTYLFSTTTRCSYDPNEKAVTPQGCGPQGLIVGDQTLTYFVQFQNLGTAPATDVVVRDTLDDDLDIASLQLLGSSHPVQFASKGRELVWTFAGINLPDDKANEPGSHGHLRFQVRPLTGLAIGTTIENLADIYFDANPAVRTGTTLNTITDQPLPVASFTAARQSADDGLTYNFTYTGGTVEPEFLWNFGPGAVPETSTVANPTEVLFPAPGPRWVTLQVRLGDCLTAPAVLSLTVGEPWLNVRQEGNQVLLWWVRDGFVLQERLDLELGSAWADRTAGVTFADGQYSLTVPIDAASGFYRLRSQ